MNDSDRGIFLIYFPFLDSERITVHASVEQSASGPESNDPSTSSELFSHLNQPWRSPLLEMICARLVLSFTCFFFLFLFIIGIIGLGRWILAFFFSYLGSDRPVSCQQYVDGRRNSSTDDAVTDREAHQWTFPIASNTVYSSSDDSNDTTSQNSYLERPKPKSKRRTQKLPKSSGSSSVTSAKNVNPHPSASSENEIAQQKSLTTMRQNHPVPVDVPASSKAPDSQGEGM